MRQNLPDSVRRRFGLFCGHASLRTRGADRRSRADQSGHHAVPTCRQGDLSALGHVGFPTEDDVAEGCVQRFSLRVCDPHRRNKVDGSRRQSLPTFRRLWTGTGQPRSDRQRVQRGHQPDQPAGRSREPHPLWSSRASSRSRLALRTLLVSPSQGDRLPQRNLFAVGHRLQQSPRSWFRGLAFTDPTSTSTAKASIRRSRSCRAPPMPGLGIRRYLAWVPNPARCAAAYPSGTLLLARISTHRLSAR
jgi:hypothetical protein